MKEMAEKKESKKPEAKKAGKKLGYKKDHVRVFKVLAAELPKRTLMTTATVVRLGFKNLDEADRTVRNAYRMMRERGHVEIAERGKYRLTATGMKYYERLAENGFELSETVSMKRGRTPMTPEEKEAKRTARVKAKETAKKYAKKLNQKPPKKELPEIAALNQEELPLE